VVAQTQEIWCFQTGDGVFSDRRCDVFRQEMWCFQTGDVVFSDRRCGVSHTVDVVVVAHTQEMRWFRHGM
jgi:hypothetical protein